MREVAGDEVQSRISMADDTLCVFWAAIGS